MPAKGQCPVCDHPDRLELDCLLLDGETLVAVSQEAGCSDESVRRHLSMHLPELVRDYRTWKSRRKAKNASRTTALIRQVDTQEMEIGALLQGFADLRLFLVESINELRGAGDHRGVVLGIKAMMELLEKAQAAHDRINGGNKAQTSQQVMEGAVLNYKKLRQELTAS